jgi:hypothetical protein
MIEVMHATNIGTPNMKKTAQERPEMDLPVRKHHLCVAMRNMV